MTKERPISYSPPMVRARNVALKKQTRRIMKNQPDEEWKPFGYDDLHAFDKHGELTERVNGWGPCSEDGLQGYNCPYGKPGDRLWVREAWRTVHQADALPPRHLTAAHSIWYEADAPHQPGYGKYRPSMFMPRWASRGLDQITSVRVERLQDISEADALAEGVDLKTKHVYQTTHSQTRQLLLADPTAKRAYERLWESMNGPGSWAANPWVWVIEFKVLQR